MSGPPAMTFVPHIGESAYAVPWDIAADAALVIAEQLPRDHIIPVLETLGLEDKPLLEWVQRRRRGASGHD